MSFNYIYIINKKKKNLKKIYLFNKKIKILKLTSS